MKKFKNFLLQAGVYLLATLIVVGVPYGLVSAAVLDINYAEWGSVDRYIFMALTVYTARLLNNSNETK